MMIDVPLFRRLFARRHHATATAISSVTSPRNSTENPDRRAEVDPAAVVGEVEEEVVAAAPAIHT
jgi:hypothetical protein